MDARDAEFLILLLLECSVAASLVPGEDMIDRRIRALSDILELVYGVGTWERMANTLIRLTIVSPLREVFIFGNHVYATVWPEVSNRTLLYDRIITDVISRTDSRS